MICQNCKSEVDDDLVFCTECGARLHETISTTKTDMTKDSVVTQINNRKPNSKLKIATVIVGILALFTVFGVAALLLFNPFSQKTGVQNTTPKPSKTPASKPTNQNKNTNANANNSNTNIESANSTNENNWKEPPKLATVIVNDRINLYADSSVAYSFTVKDDLAKIVGKSEVTGDGKFEGYVFSQQVYDENQVNPEMKVFSFEDGETEQFLPNGDYVLVFANSDGKGASLNTKFTQTPANPAK